MCPAGYVLNLQQAVSAGAAPAVCTLCKQGTYSLQPLASVLGASGAAPACIGCPAGADCANGGADVLLTVGSWIDVDGVYVLRSCPAGHQLINSTSGSSRGVFSNSLQECRACVAGQYIIDPNHDQCQPCPPGPRLPRASWGSLGRDSELYAAPLLNM